MTCIYVRIALEDKPPRIPGRSNPAVTARWSGWLTQSYSSNCVQPSPCAPGLMLSGFPFLCISMGRELQRNTSAGQQVVLTAVCFVAATASTSCWPLSSVLVSQESLTDWNTVQSERAQPWHQVWASAHQTYPPAWLMLLPAVSAWPRWSTAAATWRFDSTASTCLRLTAAIRTSGWWLSAIRSRPAPSLRSNCTATCSCSEPVWTWSSSSSTHGMSAHRLQLLLTGQRRVRRLALSWSLSFYRIVFKHEWPAWDVKARPERTFGFFWVFRRGREWSLCAWAWLTAGCSYIEHNLWFHQLGQRAPCVTVGMMFFSWHAVLYHMYGDSDLLYCFPQSLGDHQNVFVECLCCWSAQFAVQLSHGCQ